MLPAKDTELENIGCCLFGHGSLFRTRLAIDLPVNNLTQVKLQTEITNFNTLNAALNKALTGP